RDPDDDVRQEVAFALGEIGDNAKPALPALQAALQDRSGVVQTAAREAIDKINDTDGEEDDDSDNAQTPPNTKPDANINNQGEANPAPPDNDQPATRPIRRNRRTRRPPPPN
ncbi:HEAT repeat domain-containing protein, partial [Singulisphaera rosea]